MATPLPKEVVDRIRLEADKHSIEEVKTGIEMKWARADYIQGATREAERAQPVVEALQAWLDWEKEQIAKEGPYVGKRINELIAAGEAALALYLKPENGDAK